MPETLRPVMTFEIQIGYKEGEELEYLAYARTWPDYLLSWYREKSTGNIVIGKYAYRTSATCRAVMTCDVLRMIETCSPMLRDFHDVIRYSHKVVAKITGLNPISRKLADTILGLLGIPSNALVLHPDQTEINLITDQMFSSWISAPKISLLMLLVNRYTGIVGLTTPELASAEEWIRRIVTTQTSSIIYSQTTLVYVIATGFALYLLNTFNKEKNRPIDELIDYSSKNPNYSGVVDYVYAHAIPNHPIHFYNFCKSLKIGEEQLRGVFNYFSKTPAVEIYKMAEALAEKKAKSKEAYS